MMNRLGVARCCCGEPAGPDSCPCLEGTLAQAVAGSITVSGVIMRSAAYCNMNGTFGSPLTAFPGLCGGVHGSQDTCDPFTLSELRRWDIEFTRKEAALLAGFTVLLPPGLKALIRLSQFSQSSSPGISFSSAAIFYKVLTGVVDGFVDCSLALSGFVLSDQINPFDPGNPTLRGVFDAAAATVSFAP